MSVVHKFMAGDELHQPFETGLDADKPLVPAIGDHYYATDTKRVYQCQVAGAWIILTSTPLFTIAYDYGTSASSSTQRTSGVKVAYGQYALTYGAYNFTISNLPFGSSTSYSVVFSDTVSGTNNDYVTINSASSFSFASGNVAARTIFWTAIGT